MIGLKVPENVKEALQEFAEKEHRPLGNLVRLLLYEGVKVRYGVDFFKEGSESGQKRKKRL